MPTRKTVTLPGSERQTVRGAQSSGPVDGNQIIEVRVTLKAPESVQKKFDELASQPVEQRQHLTREEFAAQYGTDQATIAQIEEFARAHNLSVSSIDRAQHAVHLTGSVRDLSLAFQTYLENFELPDGASYRGRSGSIHIPDELAGIISSVNGLDNRPVAKPKFRVRPALTSHAGPAVSYTPQELAKLYSFPSATNPGQGQCIAIIELGGGFRQTDLTAYFGPGGPTVSAISVDRGHNAPIGNPDSADGEVMLDIEVAGAVAPSSAIAVYFAPNTNKGFLDSISTAVHDSHLKPSVISISWGSPEDGSGYSQSVLNAFGQIFQAAAVMGVSVLAAAGDNGSSDGLTGDHVDYPAADPSVTACGGTRLLAPDKLTIQSETVWNDGDQGGATGGGVSRLFPVPTYQKDLSSTAVGGAAKPLTGRGVPDVAANADPQTGYEVLVDGERFAIGGTSAVAPLMAGLVALINQSLGKSVGFLNPLLYGTATACRDVTNGNNGTFAAATGWDACTGVGVPVGTALLSMLKGQATKATKA